MKQFRKYSFLIASLALFAVAFIIENQFINKHPEKKLIAKFEEKFQYQEQLLDETLDEIEQLIVSDAFSGNFQAELVSLSAMYSKHHIGFMILEGNEILYWSNNHFSFGGRFPRLMQNSGLVELPNGTYFSKSRRTDGLKLIGLIHIKNNYSIQNQYVENKFVKPFNLPDGFAVQKRAEELSIPVNDLNGDYVFSILPMGKIHCNSSQLLFPATLFVFALICLFLFARRMMKEFRDEHFLVRIIILGLSLFGFYWLHLLFKVPSSFYVFELFGPSVYAFSFWLPSLGDFSFLAVIIFFWALNFVKELKISENESQLQLISALTFAGLFYLFVNYLVQNLIVNSSLTLELNHIGEIDSYSVIGLFIIVILFLSAFLINLKIIELGEKLFSNKKFLRFNFQAVIVFGILAIILRNTYVYAFCLFLVTSFSVIAFRNTQLKRYSFSYLIYFVSVFAFFSLLIIQENQESRKVDIQELMAVTLNSEHDPAAEVFLKEIQEELSVDSIVPFLLSPPYENLETYLNRRYFSGYFRKYDIQVTACAGYDSLLVEPDNQMVPCFPFFDEMIDDFGTQIPGTSFYYLDNMNGRISYFGKFLYPLVTDSIGVSVFLEFNSKLLPEGAGFPELLLDNSMIKPERYRNFSYAKFFDRSLVHLSGDYQYNYYIDSYEIPQDSSEFTLVSWDGYDHLVYRLGGDNFIFVSAPSFEFLDYLISFPYLFVFYFLVILLLIFIGNPNFRRQVIIYDLRFKIQASIIAVVLGALLVVAAGTIFYNIQEYEAKHQYDLNEKMKSIAEEIDHRLNDVDVITRDVQDWMERELNKLSNIFRTDINIYGVDGRLLATSRPEIFYRRGILSDRMNSDAYFELVENYQVSYYQPERIGNLRYSSIYEPIINNNGDYLGFINLPYFTRGDRLKQEISTFIVAFINLYVLLFLAGVIVAVFLANQITRPLSLIRDRLKGIQLTEKNEQISYHRDDEIGSLVKEYNRKVEELAESAELLARTERELAWREMAKQVAHEIKNPLTPMKLNIQYLQRAKEENSELYDDYFKRVTTTLIEQIDALSEIATEFSNFAKIPKANNEVFDLCEKLIKVTGLFESNIHIDFSLDLNGNEEVLIFADREQISRVVINLIKNAIQSIPPERKGEIKVSLSEDEVKAIISVDDNGNGIPEEIRQQMFQPNFTTKSSGMGLGLAIVNKIIENLGGRIWYETELKKGSTFYIEIPLHKK